ncbi:DUF4145 domain-containing protein [Pseudomonas syringae]|uniref:DUF4145 domain-containing protein n=1 Tax=Pseudomonas syringae TaxID=317 RepID=UPI0018E5CF93|nr:DUF4145 domain-containing protein [Pseudomonas syringae]MBI6798620.1 DUF4145 domain-containing protein [Pseudomonas syringae]
MLKLPASSIKAKTTVRNRYLSASSVSTTCPFCLEKVIFSLNSFMEDANRDWVSASAICPGCGRTVSFLTAASPSGPDGEKPEDTHEFFMFPGASSGYAYPVLPETVPASLQRSLTSTIDSLNAKNFPATAVGARRTLEGIFKYRVDSSDRTKNLYQLIDLVKNSNDLAAPLETLSHAIRSGGNLGAHFDDENEPTEAMAGKMVELLDYLISYLYVLPSKITDLEKSLGKE